MSFADRVKETTTVAGTGSATLLGAVAGYRAVAAAYGIGDRVPYCIEGQTPGEWEVGSGTLTDSTHLARTTVTASSNAGALVNFSAGTKNVFATAPASDLNKMPTSDTLAFATAIPLTALGYRSMPQQSVASVLAFTVAASPVQDALVHVRLIADGTNAPTFSGMREWGGSSGWVNTANILNVVQFWCDGTDVWYSIAQDANGATEPVPATAVTLTGPTSVVVNVASSNYTVGTDGTRPSSVLVTPTPVTNVTFTPSSVTLPAGTSTGTFTATSTTTGAKTIAVTNNGGLTDPSNITLMVNAAATVPGAPTIGTATAGDASLSVTFTAPGSDGGSAITGYTASVYKVSDNTLVTTGGGSTSPISVTGLSNAGVAVYAKIDATNAIGTGAQSAASNSVTPAATGLQLSPKNGLTESGSAPWTYTGQGGTFVTPQSGVVTMARQVGVDGSLAITCGTISSGDNPLMGLHTAAAAVAYSSMTLFVYGTSGAYSAGGASSTAGTSVAPVTGDILRLRWTGTTVIAEVARSGTPTTFVTLFTWTGVSTSALYIECSVEGSLQISNLTGSGLA